MNDYVQLHNQLSTIVDHSAREIAPVIFDLLNPTSILDVGCGDGSWLACFHELGVSDILGLDGDYIDRSALKIKKEYFQACDLSRKMKIQRQFDLALCLEVGEHLPITSSESLIETLVVSSPVVIFSAAIPGQGGVNHINEQWQSFWITLFDKHGYDVCDVLRPIFWDNENVAYYYAQNMFLFIRRGSIDSFPKVKWLLEQRSTISDFMHPTRVKRIIKSLDQNREISISQGIAAVWCGIARKFGF